MSCWNNTKTVVQDTLNNFMSLGRDAWAEARKTIMQLFTHSQFSLSGNDDVLNEVVIPMVRLHDIQ